MTSCSLFPLYYVFSAPSSRSVWVLSWAFRLLSLVKLFAQVRQVYLELWAVALCALSCSRWAKLSSHCMHVCGLCPTCLCARRAKTEGNMRSQSASGQGIWSSEEEQPSVGGSLYSSWLSAPSCFILLLSPVAPWAACLGLRPRFLPCSLASQFISLANFSWCCRSSSSVWKLWWHLQHWKVFRSSACSGGWGCTAMRWLRSRDGLGKEAPQSLQGHRRSLHSWRLCWFSCKILNSKKWYTGSLQHRKEALKCLPCPHLGEGKEAFLAVRADKGLLLCAVGGLMLAELLGRGEELFTFVACEDSVTLKNQKKYMFVCLYSFCKYSQ